MVAVKERSSGSWLDPKCSGLLGYKLGKRLWNRCQGRRGVFLTLTYRRDEYSGPIELYRRAAAEQHVALFMRRLSRRLGRSLKGKWICKLEFQEGGWVHFHLLILGVERIEHATLKEAWGHGFVWIKRLNKTNCMYLTKYVAKGDAIPAFLYDEPPRSVKIIRVSPGFWLDTSKRCKASESSCSDDESCSEEEQAKRKRPRRKGAGCGTIGERILRSPGVIVRADGKVQEFDVDYGEFLWRYGMFAKRLENDRGWLRFTGSMRLAERAAAACTWGKAAPARGTPAGTTPQGEALYLKECSNPDAVPFWKEREYMADCPSHDELMEEALREWRQEWRHVRYAAETGEALPGGCGLLILV